MVRPQMRWYRLFAVHFSLAAICLVTGFVASPPFHDVLLVIGVLLIGGFVPVVMAIYFLRGLLRMP